MDRISRIKKILKDKEIKEMKSFQNKWLDEGRAEGRVEGFNDGKQNEKISIAKAMIKADEKIEKIISYTGLSKQEIEGL